MHALPDFRSESFQWEDNENFFEANTVALQDFMGFLHIGWDLATTEDLDEKSLIEMSPAWEAASKVHPQLQNAMGTPALASAKAVVLLRRMYAEGRGCCALFEIHRHPAEGSIPI